MDVDALGYFTAVDVDGSDYSVIDVDVDVLDYRVTAVDVAVLDN